MRVFQIIEKSNVNGPGDRFCIWLSGCYRACPMCFNSGAALYSSGTEISVDELLKKIKKSKATGLSISGGEPFYQDEELSILLKKALSLSIDTLVFTGYTYSQLLKLNFKSLQYCTYIVEGAYIDGYESSCSFAGSGNQRFLRLESGKIAEDLTSKTNDDFNKTMEIIIDENGALCTGYLSL